MKRRVSIMRACRAAFACALLIALGACGSDRRPAAEPAPIEPAPAAPATPAAPLVVEPALEPSPEQLPLEADFAPQAEQEIDANNFHAALDALEKEIASDKPR